MKTECVQSSHKLHYEGSYSLYANDRGITVHVACLDIEKAFDKDWQNGLLYKLHEKDINSTLWQIIADSFKKKKLCVSIKGYRPKWFLVGQGVHQGDPLSSLLFQIFFDNLLKDIQNSNNGVKVYDTEIASPSFADYMSLISLSRKGLQKMVTIAYKYSRK